MDGGKAVACIKPVRPGIKLTGKTHLHDIYAKGQKMYGTAMQAYGWYQTARVMYTTLRPLIQEGLAL